MTTKLDQLADKFLDAQINLDGAKERFEEAKATFIEALKAENKFNPRFKTAGHAKFTISPNRTFDAEGAAREFLDEEDYSQVIVEKVDPKLVTQYITPKQKEKYMKDNAVPFKIGIKVLGDDD